MPAEGAECAAVAWLQGTTHAEYEDAFALLVRSTPRVAGAGRGEVLAVFDGVTTTPMGRQAAQEMVRQLERFFLEPDRHPANEDGLRTLLAHANDLVSAWQAPPQVAGACAGTVVWVNGPLAKVFHAGDTGAVLLRGSAAEPLVESGARGAPLRHFFGKGPLLCMAEATVALDEGDLLMLYSDGLTKTFEPAEAGRRAIALLAGDADLRSAAEALAGEARRCGSQDDITVALWAA
ncbi:MAG: SpoIIE family protein phosphatase [Myxococcales bacterium]